MKRFAALYLALDGATSTQRKLAALNDYFDHAPAADAAWASYFLAGGKPRQTVNSRVMRPAAARAAGIPDWLFDECYDAVGDLAETIALVLPPSTDDARDIGLAACMEEIILPLRGQTPEQQGDSLLAAWRHLEDGSRFVFTKLITGAFRVGVSRLLVTQALARHSGAEGAVIAQRLMSYLRTAAHPTAEAWRKLIGEAHATEASAQPYPFFLAQSLAGAPEGTLGARADWLAEWKWDGIRGQLVRRGGFAQLWSRGDELIGESFPELLDMGRALPDGCVIDGEVIGWDAAADRPLPFALLQTRISRKRLSAAQLQKVPVVLIAYDLLELAGRDLRALPLGERRARLVELVRTLDEPRLRLSAAVPGEDWPALAEQRRRARERGAEGLMLKRLDSPYGVGRTKQAARGEWWKWKLDPMSIDAVLVYAQPGNGRRASLFTDYSFAVWNAPPGTPDRQLVQFAKAYSGLTDAEIREVDAFVRRHTLEKFGPVRSVKPALVMEIGFEGIQRSTRHKSGVAVRFPRILRIRHDKPADEADTVEALRTLLDA